jgi:2-oxo-4-hydroxy-4-carboxy-5-ureidoimidazoline decarboxylase
MSDLLKRWNLLSMPEAERDILACGGSRAWARGMANRRPIANETALLTASDEIWRNVSEQDWNEAFQSHPRIGEPKTQQAVQERSGAWSKQEQSSVARETDLVRAALAEGNREYEQRFGRIFIVSVTGKSGAEILEILRGRLRNDPATEMLEAAEQQRQITRLRLKKWLDE